MSKLLTGAIATSLLVAAGEFNLENFVKTKLVRNPKIKVLKVIPTATIPLKGRGEWKAVAFTMDLAIGSKKRSVPEILFVNEKQNLAAMDLLDLKTGVDLRRTVHPELGKSYYDPAHLIAGKADAPHKLVVFSDPQCPFCMEFTPKLYQDVKAHSDKVALYYYHFPLERLHPVSKTLVRVMEVLQKQGKIDEAMKLYTLKIDSRTTDRKKILDALKKQLGITIDPAELDKPEIEKAVKSDIEKGHSALVQGTPTLFIDGKFAHRRSAYKDLLK